MRALIPHRTASVLFSTLLLAGVCLGQTTERVSVDSSGAEGNDESERASISADGRYVAFASAADNLVPGDTGWASDIFVHDRQTGVTERVSVDSSGLEGNWDSGIASLSADGRFVAFESRSSNLVPGDTNSYRDIFVHDRQTGVTERVSVDSSGVQGNHVSSDASISADGRCVAFKSISNNLVPGDTNSYRDIFVHDRQTGITERVSVDSLGAQGNSRSYSASISGDGRYVAFHSGSDNLVLGDTNGGFDVFVHDRETGITERVSVDSSGAEGTGPSYSASISADGRFVAFASGAPNLVSGDTNRSGDIFVHDRQTGGTERVSVSSSGGQVYNGSSSASISADGRYVAFQSQSNNLVFGDTNQAIDIFVHDRQTGVTERVSVNSQGIESEGGYFSRMSVISAGGRYVAYQSNARNFVYGDTNGESDVFAHDRWDGLGQNSIYLTGPATAPTGAPVEFSWQSTRGDSDYLLACSKNINGALADGHQFDLGGPVAALARGVNSTNGLGSHTLPPVPPRAAGYTIYFEVAARDANGVIYDSNVVGVTFF
jgi:WD40 repeat protein